MKKITTPLNNIETFRAGDMVLLSGAIITGRDAAHKKMAETLSRNEPLPFDINGECIYYTGPCPATPGMIINSCGPTTSSRMDAYTPVLMNHGLKGMIGKGDRDEAVINEMKEHSCVYFAATGGAGALIAQCVESAEVIAFLELGAEAVYRLVVKDFPLIVAIDCFGTDYYSQAGEQCK